MPLPTLNANEHEAFQFVPGWDGQWQHHASNGSCALSLQLAEYGEARFVASADMSPVFELQAHQDFHAPGPINVTRFAPQWHPQDPLEQGLGVISHIDGGGAVAKGALAADMLFALREGLYLRLAAPASFNKARDIALYLPAKDLRPALDAFLRCAQTSVQVSWQKMSRTRISYEVDGYHLDDAAKAQLRSLTRYVLQDPSINKLFVDGHTDNSGTKKGNVLLAKNRAATVVAYLRECGLKDRQITMRYHGAAYPVADNNTVQGKAENRRTTVRLERAEPGSLALK